MTTGSLMKVENIAAFNIALEHSAILLTCIKRSENKVSVFLRVAVSTCFFFCIAKASLFLFFFCACFVRRYFGKNKYLTLKMKKLLQRVVLEGNSVLVYN